MKRKTGGGSRTTETTTEPASEVRYEIHFLRQEGGQWIRHVEKNDGKGFDIHEAMDRMREISAVDGRSMGFEIRKIKDG